MNLEDAFKMLMKDEISNLVLLNEDGANFLEYIKNKSALSDFQVTINCEPGKTMFKKIVNGKRKSN